MRNPIIPIKQTFINLPGAKAWDYKAICGFAATGFFLDNDTYYINQKVVRPAVVYTDGTEETYFRWHYSPREISFERAVDEFTELFERITQDQIKGMGAVILPLSGGLDSRSLAAALKGHKDVRSYSYRFEHSFDETKYGAEISRRMGWKYDSYVIPSGYLWGKVDELYEINKGYADFLNPRQMAVVEEFPTMGDIFYLGHGGDLFFDSMGVPSTMTFEEQVQGLYKKIVRKGGIEVARSLWRYWNIEGSFDEWFNERLKAMLRSIDIDDANARLRAFKSSYYVPRWTCVNLGIFAKYHPLALPYFDNRMCEWLCTVPERFLAGRKIQIEYIKRKSPELAIIPWQSYDPCNLYTYEDFGKIRYQVQVVKNKFFHKIEEIISGRVITTRNWEIQFLGKENDAELKKCLFSGRGIAPKEVCEEFYKRFKQGNQNQRVYYSHPISTLLTLSKKCE